MKAALNSSIRASGCGSSTATNCGRKARKKIESFGLRMLIRIAVTMTRRLERVAAAGRGDHDQRGQQERKRHALPLTRRLPVRKQRAAAYECRRASSWRRLS